MVKAVIFDLDGTLLNTLADLASSTNYALGHYGYPQRTIDEIRRFVGNGVAKLIERAVPEGTSEADVQRVLSCFKSHYLEHSLDTTVPYDGIMDMLSVLKKKGIATAIVSNIKYPDSYEWQRSTNNSTWTTIDSDAESSISETLTTTTLYYYRCRAVGPTDLKSAYTSGFRVARAPRLYVDSSTSPEKIFINLSSGSIKGVYYQTA